MDSRHSTRNGGRRIRNLVEHPDPYVTTSELAAYWMVSRKQIYKQIEAGTLKAIRLGPRLLRISTAEAIEFEKSAKMMPSVDRHPPERASADSRETSHAPAAKRGSNGHAGNGHANDVNGGGAVQQYGAVAATANTGIRRRDVKSPEKRRR